MTRVYDRDVVQGIIDVLEGLSGRPFASFFPPGASQITIAEEDPLGDHRVYLVTRRQVEGRWEYAFDRMDLKGAGAA